MIGQTVSHYKVLEKLGEGGMGVVYKAQDTKLDRLVALKFLPSQLSASEQDKARFVQEAKAASALNHPNVCTIHDIQDHDGQMFIVMEFVDGQTLRERKQSFSIKQVIDIGSQIADGLAAAHEQGIVHRDIKPENIMIRKDGIVQIMDFGLAKLRQASGASRLTKEGSTIGTIGYMSPEQVQGLDMDHRTDIYSLGVVLYELLAGKIPYQGAHETAIMYEIVNVDAPPLSSARQDIDPELDRIVLECLDKERDERYQSAKELSKDLKRFKRESGRQRISRTSVARPAYAPPTGATEAAPESPEVPLPSLGARGSGWRGGIPWVLAGIFFIIAVGAVFFYLRRMPAESQTIRASILPPAKVNYNTQLGGHMAISPNGLTLVFVGTDSTGRDRLWVRSLNSLTALPLPGTEDASYPFWSPDSRFIGFFASGKLKKIEATGGPPLTICDAPQGRGGTWNTEGIIVFAPSNAAGLSKVSAAGGDPTPVTRTDSSRHEVNHRWPWFLPDSKHFLYVNQTSTTGQTENDVIFAASIDSSENKAILHAGSNMAYVNGYLLFVRQDNLMAQPFDPDKLEFKGDAVPIAQQIQYSALRSKGMYSVSQDGVLVYQSGGGAQPSKFEWFDRNGRESASFGDRTPNFVAVLSPEGKRIALDSYDEQSRNADVWIYDVTRGASTRLTFDQAIDEVPIWSPDGNSIVFSSNRKGHYDLYRKNSNGTGTEDLLIESTLDKYATSWSSDGQYVCYSTTGDPKTKWDLWILPLSGDRKPRPFLQTEFSEWVGSFSLDGRWIAYQSDESGRYEIYVRPFQGSEGKWQVSTGGGEGPLWSRNGHELFFTSADRRLMAVDVKAAGSTFEAGTPHALFELDARGQGEFRDVAADGQRFLMSVTPGATSVPLTLVANWDKELRKK
jgi:serine/threonine protein kinase